MDYGRFSWNWPTMTSKTIHARDSQCGPEYGLESGDEVVAGAMSCRSSSGAIQIIRAADVKNYIVAGRDGEYFRRGHGGLCNRQNIVGPVAGTAMGFRDQGHV